MNITQIATTSTTHTCALRSDGSISCWADASGGGDKGVAEPNADTAKSFVQVVAGAGHTCALRKDGTYRCWGRRFLDTRALLVPAVVRRK